MGFRHSGVGGGWGRQDYAQRKHRAQETPRMRTPSGGCLRVHMSSFLFPSLRDTPRALPGHASVSVAQRRNMQTATAASHTRREKDTDTDTDTDTHASRHTHAHTRTHTECHAVRKTAQHTGLHNKLHKAISFTAEDIDTPCWGSDSVHATVSRATPPRPCLGCSRKFRASLWICTEPCSRNFMGRLGERRGVLNDKFLLKELPCFLFRGVL